MCCNTIFMNTDYHFLTSHFLSSRTLIRNKLGLVERYRDYDSSHWHNYRTGKIRASLNISLHITAVTFLLQKSTIFHISFSAKTVHGQRLFADCTRVILPNSQVFTTSTHPCTVRLSNSALPSQCTGQHKCISAGKRLSRCIAMHWCNTLTQNLMIPLPLLSSTLSCLAHSLGDYNRKGKLENNKNTDICRRFPVHQPCCHGNP